ncbi:hypothetical protein B0H11DRAFT_1984467 [Mycena galericulata]|nr:hypothetical protein B0H11DRAFT_1984467 [Mycena galericulata]
MTCFSLRKTPLALACYFVGSSAIHEYTRPSEKYGKKLYHPEKSRQTSRAELGRRLRGYSICENSQRNSHSKPNIR